MASSEHKKDIALILGFQIIIFVLFCVFSKYDRFHESYESKYGMFQDVHVMIFVGFGFLMTFLKRYGYSSVGLNFMLASLIIQWSIINLGFYNLDKDVKFEVGLNSLYKADIAAAAVLISMGAVLGQTSYAQLILMGLIEIPFFAVNTYIGTKMQVVDAGGSIFVHTFGAYFGLAVSFMLNRSKKETEKNDLEGASYTSDLFAMVGSIFLWIFWPSFNAIELTGDDQNRAVINTYLSLAGSCVAAFAISQLLSHENKFQMVHVQNSTLAGGVAIGTAANLMVQPYGAVLVGMIAGSFSVYGYQKLTPYIEKKTGIHDTCGVHNLHGMPGVFAGIIGVVMAGVASQSMYDQNLKDIYPAMAYDEGVQKIDPADERSAGGQALYQLMALLITIVIAVASGMITGTVLKWSCFTSILNSERFDDNKNWALEEEKHITNIENGHDNPVLNMTDLASKF